MKTAETILEEKIQKYYSHSYTIFKKELHEKIIEAMEEYASQFNKELPSDDTKRLDYLQKLMTPKDTYCEIYLAGLRNGNNDADSFQIESNPEIFEVTNAPTLRDVIDKAMKVHPLNPPQI